MPDHYKHGKIDYHPARAITLTVQLPLLLLYSKLQNDEVEETYIPPLLFRRFPPQTVKLPEAFRRSSNILIYVFF